MERQNIFIDIHVHTRKGSTIPPRLDGTRAYPTPEELIERYDKLGIEKGVLMVGVNPECSVVPQSNQEILEICEEYPDRFIPFCNVDPRSLTNSVDSPLDHLLGYYKDQGCKGIGEVTINLPFLHPMSQNLFKHAEKVGLPLTFHLAMQMGSMMYGFYDEPGLPQFELTLQRFPKLKFFAHSQAFWAEIGRLKTPADRFGYPDYPIEEEGVVPILFRRYENLYGDLSARSGYNALARDKEYAVQFLNEFQDRLMFGTDICTLYTPTPLVDFLIQLRDEKLISETVFRKIARENAERILGL